MRPCDLACGSKLWSEWLLGIKGRYFICAEESGSVLFFLSKL